MIDYTTCLPVGEAFWRDQVRVGASPVYRDHYLALFESARQWYLGQIEKKPHERPTWSDDHLRGALECLAALIRLPQDAEAAVRAHDEQVRETREPVVAPWGENGGGQ